MAEGSTEMSLVSGDPMAKLTDDILAEIISRVPYKSTCCCKCVSTRWRDLISHPDHRKKMPQSLAGFFNESRDHFPMSARDFISVSGKGAPLVDPSLPFLPEYEKIDVLDCCNGLLLCRCWKPTDPSKSLDYVVCNPATEKWVVVPTTKWSSKVSFVRLGFEPAVSSHFHVFEFVPANVFWEDFEQSLSAAVSLFWSLFERPSYAARRFTEVGIYSSKTATWSYKDVTRSTRGVVVPMDSSVVLRGKLYLSALRGQLVSVDFEGNNWGIISTPVKPYEKDNPDDIYLSQGQLYLTHKRHSELSIWVLDDPMSEIWTWQHNVSCLQLFGELYSSIGNDYNIVSVHPEHDLIFIVCGSEKVLMSYDMDSGELCFICQLGSDCTTPYIPYVPLFSKSVADGN